MERSHQLSVPYSQRGAREARAALATALRRLSLRPGIIDDAVVVISELVTNAVRHALPGPDGRIGVEWAVEPKALWLRVRDGGLRSLDVAGQAHEAVGGRGLSIVAALATTWHLERGDDGTTVTAVFELE